MDTCICGRAIEDRSNRCSRCAALHEIGLEAGATDADIKEAYRAHVKAWHPDRYAGDARQQRVAELKLKKVNAAYDLLNTPEAPLQPQAQSNPQPAEPTPGRWQEAEPEARPEARPEASPYRPSGNAAHARPESASDDYSSWRQPIHRASNQDEPDQGEAAYAVAAPRSHRLRTSLVYITLFVAIVGGTYFLNTAQLKSPLSHHTGSAAAASIPATAGGNNAQQTAPPAVPEFFTLGSPKTEVIAVQGQPTSQDDNKFQYGLSTVTFQDDKVVGWTVFPLNPLRVILAPHSHPVSEGGYFTTGSTKDEVVAVQGTPTSISENTFQYGKSSVTFQEGKVASWSVYPASPLHVRAPK